MNRPFVTLRRNDNVFVYIGNIRGILRQHGADTKTQQQFVDEMISGDYENAIAVAEKWARITWI